MRRQELGGNRQLGGRPHCGGYPTVLLSVAFFLGLAHAPAGSGCSLAAAWDGSLLMSAQLSATDISAWAPMKGAAKRDNLCELQNSVNQWPPERALHSWASLRVCLLQCFFCSTVARFGSAMPPCASACCWRACQRRATGVAFVQACTCFVVSLQPFSGICVGDVADACGRATVLLALLS